MTVEMMDGTGVLMTNGAGTADWLRATEGLVILAYVPGDHSAQSTIGVTAQPHRESTDDVVIVSAQPDAIL